MHVVKSLAHSTVSCMHNHQCAMRVVIDDDAQTGGEQRHSMPRKAHKAKHTTAHPGTGSSVQNQHHAMHAWI